MKALGLLALRLAIGFIFIYMGYSKLVLNHEGAAAMFNSIGFPGGGSLGAYFVGFFEMLGGVMLILGVFASYAAVWLSIIMLMAMATVHRGGPLMGYFLPLAVLGGTLAIAGAGAGKYRLVKTRCHCKRCKGDKKIGDECCGGSCGGSCGSEGTCDCGQADCPECGGK